MNALRLAFVAAAFLTPGTAFAQAPGVRTLAVDGTCQRLVIYGQDFSGQCGTALVQILERGAVDLFVSFGGQGASDVADPEGMVIFRGKAREDGPAWTDHDVEFVLLGSQSDDAVETIEVSGTCTYENPAAGVASIACAAKDRSGRGYDLMYQTDGLPPVTF